MNEFDEKSIEWEEFTSEKGNKYEVGYIAGETEAGFKATSAIHKYSVNKHRDSFYKYIINFKNEEHYDYNFYDQTGDHYRCNTFRNGNHWVRYNSDSPRIVYVTGS